MTNKTTYVSALTTIIEGRTPTAEELDKLTALRESIAKRNATKSDKPTKAQRANAELASAIADAMTIGTTYAIKDICALVPALNEATSQKVAPLMASLVEAGKVVKTVVKGHCFYALA